MAGPGGTLLAKAQHAYQGGDLAQAERLTRQILQGNPHQADALHLLGLIAHRVGKQEIALAYLRQAISINDTNWAFFNNLGEVYRALGQPDEAMASYQQAIRLNPNRAEPYINLGTILQNQGRIEEAIDCYRQAAKQQPGCALAHLNLGNVLRLQGNLEGAITHYQHALALQPHAAEIHMDLGNLFQTQGRLAEAIRYYRQALALKPDYAEAHANLGTALRTQGELDAAVQHLQQALRLKPGFAIAYLNLGLTLRAQKKLAEAEKALRQAVRLAPSSAVAYNNLGIVLQDQGRLREAIACYRQALQLRPHYAKAHANLGVALQTQGDIEAAISCFQKALHLQPGFAEAHNNLGLALQFQGRVPEALASFQQALRLRPHFVEAHWNRALAWLLLGNFRQGWEEYEWRWRRKETPPRSFPQPSWDGTPLQGKTILVYAEQGLGDTIQFVRYLPLVQARGGRVLFECQPGLAPLLQRCQGFDELFERSSGNSSQHPFDVHIPLLSLPRIFQTTLETIPAAVPYLYPDPVLVEKWGNRLGQEPGFKIGICWQGNPQHRRDRFRSLPLRCFAPLTRIDGVRVYSLQKGAGTEQLQELPTGMRVHDLGKELDEETGLFMDTAAVMMHLDLVITIDTAIAHLAGALGVPVWLLLSSAPDWRWLLDR
ncbi:MAG: tetratricopeptide repeat protein, partial [Nitrospinota bacterium]